MRYLWLATRSLAFGGNKMFKCKTYYMGVLFAFRKNIWCMHTNYLLFLEIAAYLCITNNLSTIFFLISVSAFRESKFDSQMSARHMKGASQRHSGAKSTTNWFSKKPLNSLEV